MLSRALLVTLGVATVGVSTIAGAQSPPPPGRTGTAVVRGRITGGDSGKPLRRARISFAAPQLGGPPRTVNTYADGRYEIKDLPAGQYVVSAQRSGYLPLRYGQRRAFETARPLDIRDGQTIERIDFALPKAGLIIGHVLDEVGDPVAAAQVFALRSEYWHGRRQLVPTGPLFRTDDSGQFRLTGLAPGSYFVRAATRETWTVTRSGKKDVMSFLPTYFPGVADAKTAQSIAVGVSEQIANVDFALTPGRTLSVAGTAVDSHGRPLVNVILGQETTGPNGGIVGMAGGSPVAADGTFRIKDVTPGDYRLMAAGAGEIALMPIAVRADVENLALVASAGWSATGSIVTDNGAPPTFPRARARLATSTANDYRMRMQGEPEYRQAINDDWTFSIEGIVGAARLHVTLPDGWALKSIVQEGRDVSESSLEMKSGEVLSGLQVIVTNRVTSISGQLVDGQGIPVEGTVVVFSTDADTWTDDSRFIRAARPNQDAGFRMTGLPAGEYFAVALDYVQDGVWNDPEYLESIRRYAQRITLSEGESRTISLKLVTP